MSTIEHNTEPTVHDDLRAALDALETALSKPILPGELDDWAIEAQRIWSVAVEQIQEQTAAIHPRQYQQISKEDPEMLPRVERLRAEDVAIDEDAENFGRLVTNLVNRAPQAEPDEVKLERQTAAMVEAGVALAHRVKKQEVALRTWFIEAFNRDRGVAD